MHVPEVEREIRTIKERCRCVYATLPFKKVPALMVESLVVHAVQWLNSFPAPDSVIGNMSPRELMTGIQVDFTKHCRLEFGEYVQTHEEHDNTMASRTIGAIALTATMNEQGSYYFMSLSTGMRIHRKQWTPLPMPDDVIERVEQIAGANCHADLTFAWRDSTKAEDALDEHADLPDNYKGIHDKDNNEDDEMDGDEDNSDNQLNGDWQDKMLEDKGHDSIGVDVGEQVDAVPPEADHFDGGDPEEVAEVAEKEHQEWVDVPDAEQPEMGPDTVPVVETVSESEEEDEASNLEHESEDETADGSADEDEPDAASGTGRRCPTSKGAGPIQSTAPPTCPGGPSAEGAGRRDERAVRREEWAVPSAEAQATKGTRACALAEAGVVC